MRTRISVTVAAGAYVVGVSPVFASPRYFVRRIDVDPSLPGAQPTHHKRLTGVIARFTMHGVRLTDADVALIASLAEVAP